MSKLFENPIKKLICGTIICTISIVAFCIIAYIIYVTPMNWINILVIMLWNFICVSYYIGHLFTTGRKE